MIAACSSTTSADQHVTTLLPNGSYTYAILERGKQLATSTIVVSRANGALTIEEHASPMEPSEKTIRTLDASTLVTRSYTTGVPERTVASVTVSGDNAVVQDGTSTMRFVAARGAPFAVSDLVVGFWFHLPATLHAARTQKLTVISLGFATKVGPLTASTSTAARPSRVPKRDSALSVTGEGATGTLWYDPQTFVLDEFDVPGHQFVFARIANPER
ncbi:MAG: hypothetical protein JO177_00180 [Candidatus Eremiobacteraeota bacterium]|nr:hypothetical protein [Candidatus Eremiobacteraeota bacterium]